MVKGLTNRLVSISLPHREILSSPSSVAEFRWEDFTSQIKMTDEEVSSFHLSILLFALFLSCLFLFVADIVLLASVSSLDSEQHYPRP